MFDNEVINAMKVYSMLDNDIKPPTNTPNNILYQRYIQKAQSVKTTHKINEYSVEKIAMQLIRYHMQDLIEEIEDFLNDTVDDKILLLDHSKEE